MGDTQSFSPMTDFGAIANRRFSPMNGAYPSQVAGQMQAPTGPARRPQMPGFDQMGGDAVPFSPPQPAGGGFDTGPGLPPMDFGGGAGRNYGSPFGMTGQGANVDTSPFFRQMFGGGGPGIGPAQTQNNSNPNPNPTSITPLYSDKWNGNVFSVPHSSSDYAGLRNSLQGFLLNNINGIFAQPGQAPGQVNLGSAPQLNQQFGSGVNLDRSQIGNVSAQNIQAPQLDGPAQVNAQQISGLPGVQAPQLDGPAQVSTQFSSGVGPLSRGLIRDVNGALVSDSGTGTQSVDQLGGGNSAFFQNMVNQLQPVFDQQRAQAIAQAKESVGGLTGSGLGNTIGTAINRSLGDQQATLANYAAQGVNQELARQANQAQLAQGRNLASSSNVQQASLANQNSDQGFLSQLLNQGGLNLQAQQLGLQGQGMNQGAQQSYDLARANMGLQAGTVNAQQALDAARANQSAGLQAGGMNQGAQQSYDLARANLGLQAGTANADNALRADLANQGADTSFLSQLLQQGGLNLQGQQMGLNQGLANQAATQAYAFNQGNLDQNRNLSIYDALNNINNANAGRVSGLLGGLGTAGVAPNEVVNQSGMGALAGPLIGALGSYLGSRGGGGGLGGLLGGGGDGSGAGGLLDGLGGITEKIGGGIGSLFGAGEAGSYLGAALPKILGSAGLAYGENQLGNNAAGWLGRRVGGKAGSAVSDIGHGAATGAAIGSIIPGVGTAVGAGLGAAYGGLKKPVRNAGNWLGKRLGIHF